MHVHLLYVIILQISECEYGLYVSLHICMHVT